MTSENKLIDMMTKNRFRKSLMEILFTLMYFCTILYIKTRLTSVMLKEPKFAPLSSMIVGHRLKLNINIKMFMYESLMVLCDKRI